MSTCGRYQVYTDGRIFSIPKKRFLTGSLTSKGYRQGGGGKGKTRELIHRLVAKPFIPNPRASKYVNHKNRLCNLEW